MRLTPDQLREIAAKLRPDEIAGFINRGCPMCEQHEAVNLLAFRLAEARRIMDVLGVVIVGLEGKND